MVKIIEPEIPMLFDKPLATKQRAFLVPGGVKAQLEASLLTDQGSIWQIPPTATVKARFVEAVSRDNPTDVTGLTPGEKIYIDVPTSVGKTPAIYYLSLAALDSEDDVIHLTDYYVYVEPTIWLESANKGLPTLKYLRQALKDSSIFENELTQNYQFSLTDICYAIISAIEIYNRTPPRLCYLNRNTANFPDRSLLTQGASAQLYGLMIEHYRKNSLAYNASGLQINDNKINEYSVAYKEALAEYRQEVTYRKAQVNINRVPRILG